MRKSKLELYEEILSALADRQLSVDNLAIQCNIDCAIATGLVDFLEKNQLVENKTLAKTKRINEMQKSLAKIREDKFALPSLAELKEVAHTPSLAELKELVRTRLLARSRSRH
jgi:predicted transcriptional regulator